MREVKQSVLKGSQQMFELERWRVMPGYSAVARWVAPEGNPYGIPPKSTSWGVWSMSRPHLTAYRIHDPQGQLQRYRFDVIEDLAITNDQVFFQDLLLDATIDGESRRVELQDEDEVEEAIRLGKLTEKQQAIISAMREALTKTPSTLTREVDALIDMALNLY